MDSLWIISIFCTVFFVLLHSCFKASQTEENASSTPAPPPPSFSRSHQLRQNGNAELSRQHKNFGRSSKGNNREVILSCTNWETFANVFEDTKTSDKEKSCVICFEPMTSWGRLVPCGHSSFCVDCSQKISKPDDSTCPLCRTEIHQVNFEPVISMNFGT